MAAGDGRATCPGQRVRAGQSGAEERGRTSTAAGGTGGAALLTRAPAARPGAASALPSPALPGPARLRPRGERGCGCGAHEPPPAGARWRCTALAPETPPGQRCPLQPHGLCGVSPAERRSAAVGWGCLVPVATRGCPTALPLLGRVGWCQCRPAALGTPKGRPRQNPPACGPGEAGRRAL